MEVSLSFAINFMICDVKQRTHLWFFCFLSNLILITKNKMILFFTSLDINFTFNTQMCRGPPFLEKAGYKYVLHMFAIFLFSFSDNYSNESSLYYNSRLCSHLVESDNDLSAGPINMSTFRRGKLRVNYTSLLTLIFWNV